MTTPRPGRQRGRTRLVAAADGRQGAVTVHQDVDLWVAALEPGDGAAAVEEKLLEISASDASEILLFDQA